MDGEPQSGKTPESVKPATESPRGVKSKHPLGRAWQNFRNLVRPGERKRQSKEDTSPKETPEAKPEHPMAIRLREIRESARRIMDGVNTLEIPDSIPGAEHLTHPWDRGDAALPLFEPSLNALGELAGNYDAFVKDVLADTEMRQDIHLVYIRNIIVPRIKLEMERGNTPPEERERFDAEIAALLAAPPDDNLQLRKDTWSLVNSIRGVGFNNGGGTVHREFSDSWDLKREPDEVAIEHFVKQLAFADIKAIREVLWKKFPGAPSTIERKFLEKVGPEEEEEMIGQFADGRGIDWKPVRPFREDLCIKLKNWRGEYELKDENHLPWLQVFNESSMQDVLGTELTTKYDNIYRDFVQKAGNRSEWAKAVSSLAYVPTPEVVRDLLILAADKRLAGNSWTTPARGVLDVFARRDDWEQLLRQVEESYPNLRETIPVLRSWNSKNRDQEDRLRDAANDFLVDFIRKNKDASQDDYFTQAMVERAYAGLEMGTLMTVLEEDGLITVRDRNKFQTALQVIKTSVPREIIGFEGNLHDRLLERLYPSRYWSSEERFSRFTTLTEQIIRLAKSPDKVSYLLSYPVAKVVWNPVVPFEVILALPERLPFLLDSNNSSLNNYIFEHGGYFLGSMSDLGFLNNLIGEFSKKAPPLLKGCIDCIDAGVIEPNEKDLVLEFARQFRVIAPEIIRGYKEAKLNRTHEVYIAELKSLAEKMMAGGITESDQAKPYYADLLRHVYPKSADNWGSYESTAKCTDRSGDLEGFVVRNPYTIDLLIQGSLSIKEGQVLDPSVQAQIQKSLVEISEEFKAVGGDRAAFVSQFEQQINSQLTQLVEAGGLRGINIDQIDDPRTRLFFILADSLYGTRSLDQATVKKLLIKYDFVYRDNIDTYFAGVQSMISQAGNQDYARLSELHSFYGDRIKEVTRQIIDDVWTNPELSQLMTTYFQVLAQEKQSQSREKELTRIPVEKLGLSDSFVRGMAQGFQRRDRGVKVRRYLEGKYGRPFDPEEINKIIRGGKGFEELTREVGHIEGRQYTEDEVRKIIQVYERRQQEGKELQTSSTHLEVLYKQLRSQREKTFDAIRIITGEEVDPSAIQLGEINLAEAMAMEKEIGEGRYDSDQFKAYTTQRIFDLFELERDQVERELDKFVSSSAGKKTKLLGFVTKSQPSAHARMTAGICVADDNPGNGNPRGNLWEMPNYLQMVFQDPENLQCQGLVELHYFEVNGQNILVASPDPSSTYLYSVDERALFSGIMSQVEVFAQDNNFDSIMISANPALSTNRTGGEFERAMRDKIAKINKQYTFDPRQRASYKFDYHFDDMHIVWERPAASDQQV